MPRLPNVIFVLGNVSSEGSKFTQAVPDFEAEVNDDDDRVAYNDDAENLETGEEIANKRSQLFSKTPNTNKSEAAGKISESNKISENSSDDEDDDEEGDENGDGSGTNNVAEEKVKDKEVIESGSGVGQIVREDEASGKESSEVIASGSGEGQIVREDETSGEESSGAERERRQALQTGSYNDRLFSKRFKYQLFSRFACDFMYNLYRK